MGVSAAARVGHARSVDRGATTVDVPGAYLQLSRHHAAAATRGEALLHRGPLLAKGIDTRTNDFAFKTE